MVLHTLFFSDSSLFFHLSPLFTIFSTFQKSLPIFAYLPISIGTFFALISTTVLLPAEFLGIFSSTLSISSIPLSWNFDFWGVFVLFRLSHVHSIRQRLGENPLINMEVKIFNLLACSKSFPWFQASSGNYTWIIHAPHYE